MTVLTRAISIAIFALSLSQLAYGHALNLDKRGPCYQDNCLRALLGNSAAASPFCSAYLGPTPTATTTVPFTSVCTENPTAVSTACSCLLTATPTAPAGPTQCRAANNYGYVYEGGALGFKSAVISAQVQRYVNNRGDCCRLCYSYPNCYGFAETSVTGGGLYCELEIIQPTSGVDVSSECPLGKLNLHLGYTPTQYKKPSPSGAGQGPCGIFGPNGQL